MMIVPDAANMPPTPWQTEICIGDLDGGVAAHLAHILLQCVHTGMHVAETAAIGVERELAAGGGVMPGDEGAGLAARQWIIVTPAKAGVQGAVGTLGSGFPLSRE